MKKLFSSRPFALGLALLLVISILGTSLVPSGQALAETAPSAVQEAASVTDAAYAPKLFAAAAQSQVSVTAAIYAAAEYITQKGSLSDWSAISLRRAGLDVPDSYRINLETQVKEAAGTYGKVTDYARISLAVTAIGRDATSFAGYNLIERIYNNEESYQGINEPVYSLLALDSGHYLVPADAYWTKDKLLKDILSKQNADGGFGFTKASDPDLTAMTLNALAAHTADPEVKTAGERAIQWLSDTQQPHGGYNSSSESSAQVIIGLSSAGIDPAGAAFTKADGTVLSNLLSFGLGDGSYSHVTGGAANGLATDQALQALVAYDLFLKGEKFFDLGKPASQNPEVGSSITIEGPQGPITQGEIQAPTALQALEKLTQQKNIPLGIKDSQYGKYVASINGISEKTYGGYDGWLFAVYKDGHWTKPDVGAADYVLKASDRIMFYYGDYSGTEYVNSISITPKQPQVGQAFSVKVMKDVSVWNGTSSELSSAPAANVKVAVAGQTVTTNAEGIAGFKPAEAGGTYTLEVTGYQDGTYPTVVRTVSSVKVIAQAQVSITVEGPQGAVTQGVAKGFTALEALEQLAQEKNVPLEIKDSQYGKYVASINGISEKSYGGYDGWLFAVYKEGHWTKPDFGAADYLLQESEQLLFYYGDYSGTEYVNSISVTPAQPVPGQPFAVKVIKDVSEWTETGTKLSSKPAKGVQVTVSGQTVTTDSEGVAAFTDGKPAGSYAIEVTGYHEGTVPSLVRTTAQLTVAAPVTATATISVVGNSQKGTILSSTTVALNAGETAYSLLVRQLGSKVVSSGSGGSRYVVSIDGLAEKDGGPLSGWKYSTSRDSNPSVSAESYVLRNGDVVSWYYTNGDTPATGGGSGGAASGTVAVTVAADNTLPLNRVGQTTAVTNLAAKMTAPQAAELAKTLGANTVSVSQEVTPGAAATLKDSAEEVQLQIAAGAVESPVKIRVQEISSNRTELVSGLYDFTPDGTKFAKPVDLSIKIPVATEYPANLALAWLDKASNRWIPVPSTLDVKTGIMTGKVSHFTEYAVVDRSKWEPQQEQLKSDIAGAAKYIQAAGDISDWQAIGLARSGQVLPSSYLEAVKKQLAANQGEFRKVTDYERLALAVAAAGGDPQNIAGYNLVEKIYNNANMANQGSNGPIFALIALDSGTYSVPANAQWTKERLIQWVLKQQGQDGSFPLAAGAAGDVDITAMAVTALSSHTSQPAVAAALGKAVDWLAQQQLENGGYKLSGEENSESVAQVIIALTAAGTGPNDPRFVRTKGSLPSNLATYKQADGGYAHAAGQSSGSLPTEQALLALAAYDRFLKDENKLYSMVSAPASTSVTFEDEQAISAWALPSVHTAYDRKMMEGVSSTSLIFAPKVNITRAEFAALLLRLTNNTPAAASAAPVFSDVKAGTWYYGVVLKAKELGIIDGVTETTFKPAGVITRQDMAVMIARAFKLEGPADVQSFKDESKISPYASTAVHAVSELGYLTGFNGSFDPSAAVTREMAAVVAVRLKP